MVGKYVTVGHGAVIHACQIADECLIGMNSTILDGARIGKQSIVAAGSLVPAGMKVPAGSLVAGVPAKIKRKLSEEERKKLKGWAEKYLVVAKAHREKLVQERAWSPRLIARSDLHLHFPSRNDDKNLPVWLEKSGRGSVADTASAQHET